jgi:ribosomal protein L39E
MSVQSQIETLIDQATELTFERAFSSEAQRQIEVWLNLQQQIEYKMRCAKALRDNEPLPVEPEHIVVRTKTEPAIRKPVSDIVIEIPAEPPAVAPRISALNKELIDDFDTKFEL